MELKTIAATYGRKLNLGDYNSAHAEVTLWADLEEGDDPEAAANALRQMARNHVMEEMARVKPALAAKVQDLFMGLPVDVQDQLSKDKELQQDGPLTWDELGDVYDKMNPAGRRAKTLEMDYVFDWVSRQEGFVLLDGQIFKESE